MVGRAFDGCARSQVPAADGGNALPTERMRSEPLRVGSGPQRWAQFFAYAGLMRNVAGGAIGFSVGLVNLAAAQQGLW